MTDVLVSSSQIAGLNPSHNSQLSAAEQAAEMEMETIVIFTISKSKIAKHKEHKKEVSHVL